VASTRIFVGPTKDGRQLCVYENTVYLSGGSKSKSPSDKKKGAPTAMILPFPNVASSQKLVFVDLSKEGSKECLNDIDNAWPKAVEPQPRSLSSRSSGMEESKLAVVKVGSYTCSVAENLGDLRRVDESVFKLSANFDKLLATFYGEGYGFVICQLDAGGKQHPIGYVHDVVKSGELFTPTRHQHGDGAEEKNAHWDHKIYSLNTDSKEAGRTPTEELAHLKALKPYKIDEATLTVNEKFLQRLVIPLAPMQCIRRLAIKGKDTNRDVIFKIGAPVSG